MKISSQLLQKYNVPVPRYTSYPPANHFSSEFGESNYIQMLDESNSGTPQHLAFYFHIPFCKKICFYCGCNAYTMGRPEQTEAYLRAIKKEFALVAKHIDPARKVSQIHFGGGTPNSIDAAMLKELVDMVASSFSFIDKPEIAIECNPAYLTHEYVDALKQAGFNRFSLGIQDFNDEVLRTVNRDSSRIPVDELVAFIKKGRSDIGVNLDFIYGLPGQTVESFLESVEKAAAIRPDRLVTFSYAHVPWMKKHQMILEKRGLPSSEVKMEMFLSAYALLKQKGYQPVGLDHFVLPTDELFASLESKELHRNFQGYCTRRTTGQVYAFGVTAISQLEKGYAQNVKDIAEYIATIENHHLPIEKGYTLSSGEIITRETITELMCNKRVSWSDVASKLGVPVEDVRTQVAVNDEVLAGFAADELIRYTSDEITVTELGAIFIRNIAAALDSAYQQQANSYSKTV